jgi:hypothetical protein
MGFLLSMFVFVVLYAQYSDYAAKSQAYRIITEFRFSSLREAIEEERSQRETISMDVKKEGITFFEERRSLLDLLKIADLGIVAIRGTKGQAIVLMPSVQKEGITWCRIIAPSHADSDHWDYWKAHECFQSPRLFCLPKCQGIITSLDIGEEP